MIGDNIDHKIGIYANAQMYLNTNPLSGLFFGQPSGDALVLDPLTGEKFLIAIIIATALYSGEEIFAILTRFSFDYNIHLITAVLRNYNVPYLYKNYHTQLRYSCCPTWCLPFIRIERHFTKKTVIYNGKSPLPNYQHLE